MNKPQEKSIYINDHKISYLEQGEGSPVILIHGIPTSSLLWRKIMPELARTHTVFAPDMLNYGKSDKPAMADDVIDLYLAPWSTEEGKKALFHNFRRLFHVAHALQSGCDADSVLVVTKIKDPTLIPYSRCSMKAMPSTMGSIPAAAGPIIFIIIGANPYIKSCTYDSASCTSDRTWGQGVSASSCRKKGDSEPLGIRTMESITRMAAEEKSYNRPRSNS